MGGTLTGNLAIAPTGNAILNLIKTGGSTNVNVIAGLTSGVLRWQMQLGNGNPESGSSAGSDFAIYNYNNAGAYIGNPLSSIAPLACITLPNGLIVNSNITAGQSGIGQVILNPGNPTNTGYIAFHDPGGTRQGYLGYAAGGGLSLQVENSTSQLDIGGIVRAILGRIVSQGSGGLPSVTVYDNGAAVAGGMWQEAGGNLSFGDCDSNGVPTVRRMYLDRSNNLWVTGAVTTAYLHSTGSVNADGNVSAGTVSTATI